MQAPDSSAGASDDPNLCATCGTAIRIGEKDCVNCLLREGLGTEGEASRAAFERILEESSVPDKSWRLGHYEILEEIGRGGMGVIYRARQRPSQRIVALKRVLAEQADSPETLARFRREAEAVASLDHPHILPIYEVSESGSGLPFFSMKFAAGGSLRTAPPRLRTQPNECVRLLAKVARAIDYAHRHKILHRDLQPGNILLDPEGEPLVSDFGLAKWLEEKSDLTQTLTTFGTPGFIAPEQAEGTAADLTPAADIYSLGAILFFLLAGRPPFLGANALVVIHQALATPAPRLRSLAPSADRDLETIVARCLEREPQARYASAEALAEDLERWLEGRPILARPVHAPARLWRWSRRNPVLASAAAACLLLSLAVIWLWRGQVATAPASFAPEKSIAVLPFENLSDDKQNAYFAAGIQDDVLTSLAQIHELKVISHTSVMAYRPGAHNMHEIGQALGVANVLEGSVRRAGDRVLINVQLIDTRTDRHLWAELYDRTVADSIGLQGELAREIAEALKAQLAPEEKASLERKPTDNPEAYALYLQARGRERASNRPYEHERATEQLYAEAIALDPKFALAHARRSIRDSYLAFDAGEKAARAQARSEAEEALRLSPSLGEGHTALGLSLYWADKNYAAALKEFAIAAAKSPNEPDILTYIGGIYRRQGRWRESLATFQRAQDLDPRNRYVFIQAANSHLYVRDWAGASTAYKRALEIAPGSAIPMVGLAYLEIFQNNSPAAGRKILQSIPPGIDPDGIVTEARWDLALLERDYAGAERILTESSSKTFALDEAFLLTFYKGRTALARGDVEAAQRYLAAATPGIEERVRDTPEDPERRALLALLYGYMQRKEDALREGRRAVELEPESQNAFHGAQWAANLALVYALVGEQDQAITLIERLLATPGPVPWQNQPSITLAELRLRWEWDSLRSNPRFQKILAGLEPKTIY